MSWNELERLVVDAEGRPHLRRLLRRCSDDNALLLQARLLGYRITRCDLADLRCDFTVRTRAVRAGLTLLAGTVPYPRPVLQRWITRTETFTRKHRR